MKDREAANGRGDFDPAFADGGVKILQDTVSQVVGLTPLQDGRLLVAGAEEQYFLVACLLNDGSVDRSFGEDGFIRGAFQTGDSTKSIGVKAIDAGDGRVLVTGTTRDPGGGVLIAFARYHASGALDESYGDGGRRILFYPGENHSDGHDTGREGRRSGSDGAADTMDVVIGDDGKPIVSWWFAYETKTFLFRLDENGDLDPEFNGVGYVGLSEELGTSSVSATHVLASGNILVGGEHGDDEGRFTPYLVQYLPDGREDPDFGIVFLDEYVGCVFQHWIETAAGDLVGFGRTAVEDSQGLVIRLRSDGSVDDTFHADPVEDVWQWVKAEAAGSEWVVIGHTTSSEVVIARYGLQGKLNINFGNGRGWVRHKILQGENTVPHDLSVRSDRITVVGSMTVGLGEPRGFVARFIA